ncbi:MAG: TetR/AcrR family transcriptional regulator [Pseudomonadota bacterium]
MSFDQSAEFATGWVMGSVRSIDSRKHRQIIDAAVVEFQEKGFSGASMDRVSARANVSKRTVYKYFSSKENLFAAIVEIFSEYFAEMAEIQYDPNRPIRDQLTDLGWAEGEILMSPEIMSMARMLISETLRNPALAHEAEGKIDKTKAFNTLMRGAAETGQLHLPNPDAAASEYLSLIKGKAFWPVMLGADIVSRDEMWDIIEKSVDMIMARYSP